MASMDISKMYSPTWHGYAFHWIFLMKTIMILSPHASYCMLCDDVMLTVGALVMTETHPPKMITSFIGAGNIDNRSWLCCLTSYGR